MGKDNNVDWPTCSEDGCIGIRLDAGGKCLAHADSQDLDAELKRLGEEGTIDARGVTIDAVLLGRLCESAPSDVQQGGWPRPRFGEVWFDRAAFGNGASFGSAIFSGHASFADASFEGGWTLYPLEGTFAGATFGVGARFDRATFGNKASFHEATFGDLASFTEATFGDGVRFDAATFGNRVRFDRASFGDHVSFTDVTFGDEATFDIGDGVSFVCASFGDDAWFYRANLGEGADFSDTTFGNKAVFSDATFIGTLKFCGATFGEGTWLGPLLSRGELVLREAQFGRGSTLAINADGLDCDGMRLPDGALLNVRWADVRLDRIDFGRPTLLVGAGLYPRLDEARFRQSAAEPWRTSRPRVVSLHGSDVRNLTLSNVDLRSCRFTGAHNLDQLRLEATIDFADCPAGLQGGWRLPPLWRWTRRRTLAEEHRWRHVQSEHAGWYPLACQARDRDEALQPAEIALLYRALRKGREDAKDEPGAADFYYGEMEMRRHDRTAQWAERFVLWLYWLVAGYGLRASRALGWLLGLLAAATVLLATTGLASSSAAPLTATITGTPPQQHIQFAAQSTPAAMTAQRPLPARLGTAALVAVESAVFRTSDQALTYRGRLIQTTLRFVGPVLLGLGLLSIRGRVKR